jgi:hypothetical protein
LISFISNQMQRSIRRNRQYVCKARGSSANNCAVDKTHRNQCRACRLRVCLEAGMNKEAVQHERGPRNSTIRRQVALYLKESAAAAAVVSMANNNNTSMLHHPHHQSPVGSMSPTSLTSRLGLPSLTSQSLFSSLNHLNSLPRPTPVLPNASPTMNGQHHHLPLPWSSIFAASNSTAAAAAALSSAAASMAAQNGFSQNNSNNFSSLYHSSMNSLASFNPLLFLSLPELSRSLLRSSYPYPYATYDVTSLANGLSSDRSSSVSVIDKRENGS